MVVPPTPSLASGVTRRTASLRFYGGLLLLPRALLLERSLLDGGFPGALRGEGGDSQSRESHGFLGIAPASPGAPPWALSA